LNPADGTDRPPGPTTGPPLVRRPVPAAIDQVQRLAGVGQRDHQRVIAPLALVRDIHPLLALPIGRRQRTVGVDRRLLQEPLGLSPPYPQADLVDRLHQRHNVRYVEPPAEAPAVVGSGIVLAANPSNTPRCCAGARCPPGTSHRPECCRRCSAHGPTRGTADAP